MLAYVFWHEPRPEINRSAYEAGLIEFHRRLASAGMEGFRSSASFRVASLPWIANEGEAYEDWYAIDASFALDALNEAAVSGDRKVVHDGIARASAAGVGGLYRVRTGKGDSDTGVTACWFAKPAGMNYEELYRILDPIASRDDRCLWRRQMVLGPAPEFCLTAAGAVELPPSLSVLRIQRRLVC